VLLIGCQLSCSGVSPHLNHVNLGMYFLDRIKQVRRWTWRPRVSELRDALRGWDSVNLQMNLEAVIRRVWRCTWMPGSCTPGCWDWASLEMHWEAGPERVYTCTEGPWSIKIGQELGGAWSGGGRSGGRRNRGWDCIHWFTCNCGNVESVL